MTNRISSSSLFLSPFLSKYNFENDILDIIIGGKSPIDSPHAFSVNSIEEADRFIRTYGYNLDDPIEKAEVLGTFYESLNFIRTHFLQPENPEGLKLEIPRKILELTDVRELFLMVTQAQANRSPDAQQAYVGHWACSALKVMHTISHIDKDLRTPYFPDIQTQILDRFYKFIQRDADGKLFLGERPDDPYRVNLVAFETKPKKSRTSIILKLLHKPENVAEDIFDRVGIRFITHTPLDAIRVIKVLKDQMLVMPPNIKPSRSRNTLVQMDDFRTRMEFLLSMAKTKQLPEDQLESALQAAIRLPESESNSENPHTSSFYRAIQFTCRQLIKLRNPIYDDLRELKNLVKAKSQDDDLTKVTERIDLKYVQREISFFYPFEVQVMDQKSYEENERGRSAHGEYKKAQISTAMKRVMGSLADGIR